ncbi:MAG: ATP-binding protein [Oryzomonas sp.]|uniref:ATP-binding protein n=1 Tax=Oryzomonas sp. TaxID=2855186 RepID=UPI00283F1CE1|nr:ATP-binding protein [Oryzomonas sp.]MDR3580522.1 ATP-binding protein [Oryzomonas sp.]
MSTENQLAPSELRDFEFHFAPYCELTVDAMTFLLSYVNQLCANNHNVSFCFDAEDTIKQFDGDGFFKHLSSSVSICPVNSISVGRSYDRILTDRVIKLININADRPDQTVTPQLADAIVNAIKNSQFARRLNVAVFTIIGELIDNILQHSSTNIDGFSGVEIYNGGKLIRIAVSDSGRGILQTLRPTLTAEFPKLNRLNDTKLLIEVLKRGVSRHGQGRGCGLKTSADWAIKFGACLDIRLSNIRIVLFPDKGKYALRTPICFGDLPDIGGTHICFTFTLDI